MFTECSGKFAKNYNVREEDGDVRYRSAPLRVATRAERTLDKEPTKSSICFSSANRDTPRRNKIVSSERLLRRGYSIHNYGKVFYCNLYGGIIARKENELGAATSTNATLPNKRQSFV
jgi:hypothetical protein